LTSIAQATPYFCKQNSNKGEHMKKQTRENISFFALLVVFIFLLAVVCDVAYSGYQVLVGDKVSAKSISWYMSGEEPPVPPGK
jgi:nitrate reductase NapE component